MKISYNPIFLPSTINIADTAIVGNIFTGLDKFSRAVIALTISGKTMDASTTVDIYVQYSPDRGTTWDDIGHFAQITNVAIGNGVYVMVLNHGTAGIADRITDDAATLSANAVRNQPWCDRMRIKVIPANFAGTDTITLKVDGWFFE